MENIFAKALKKVTNILETENIAYMIVGGFAVSYHNRGRTTNDIDFVLQIYPQHIAPLLKHFPEWKGFAAGFEENVRNGLVFNLTDFETGIRYDFMAYKDSDYAWCAFNRRQQVEFLGTTCYLISKEDLILSKLQWYNISASDKQLEDLKFLLVDEQLDRLYMTNWIKKLNINTHGLLES